MRFFVGFMCILLCACTPKNSLSTAKVVNGKEISEKEFPSVVRVSIDLGGGAQATCTASVISDAVMVTASHCLVLDNGQPASSAIARLNSGVVVNGGAIHLHPQYNNKTAGNDIAFAKFPPGTFKDYIPVKLSSNVPKVGDPIKIVGFGKYDHFDGQSGGKKRVGFGTVESVGENVDFRGQTKPTDGSGSNALNSQGDSGGPMLNSDDEIIGISSTVDAVDAADSKRTGHYTSIHYSAVVPFLNKFLNGTLPENTNPTQPQPVVVNSSNDPVTGSQPISPSPGVIIPIGIDSGVCLCKVMANRYGQGCTVMRAEKVVLEAEGTSGCASSAECSAAWRDQLQGVCTSFQLLEK